MAVARVTLFSKEGSRGLLRVFENPPDVYIVLNSPLLSPPFLIYCVKFVLMVVEPLLPALALCATVSFPLAPALIYVVMFFFTRNCDLISISCYEICC